MKYIVLSLFTVSLLFASAYEGTTEELGIEFEADVFLSGSELLDNPEGTDYVEASGLIKALLSVVLQSLTM